MKSIETRIKDLELGLNPDYQQAILVVLDEYDGVSDGYFSGYDEQNRFINWRSELLRQENKYNPSKIFVYMFDEEDVFNYLQRFKNEG